MKNTPNPDRLPPHSIEAEAGVLGCIFLSPQQCVAECIDKIAGPLEFYDLRHQAIYHACLELNRELKIPDVVAVYQWLSDRKKINDVGGLRYLQELPDKVPTSSNIGHYLGIVHEKFLLRAMVQACTDGVSRIYESERDPQHLLDVIERQIMAIRNSERKADRASIQQLVADAMHQIETLADKSSELTGLSTGLAVLDQWLDGLQDSQMIVLAARPSVGKTSLAMNIAEHVALERKQAVAIFSCESNPTALVRRIICSRGRVNSRKIRGFLSPDDIVRLRDTALKVRRAPMVIENSAGWNVMQVRSRCRQIHQQMPLSLVIIDYIQLLAGEHQHRGFESRQQEVSDISRQVKQISAELAIPVLALSQINREIEKEKNRRPRLSDLRESGSIEQDADVVLFLYPFGDQPDNVEKMHVKCYVAKQREGPRGDIDLDFWRTITRFEKHDPDKREPDPWPDDRQGILV